jgi:hypothetical protein
VLRTKKNLKIGFEIEIKILLEIRMTSYFEEKASPWYFIILGKTFYKFYRSIPFYILNKRSRMK